MRFVFVEECFDSISLKYLFYRIHSIRFSFIRHHGNLIYFFFSNKFYFSLLDLFFYLSSGELRIHTTHIYLKKKQFPSPCKIKINSESKLCKKIKIKITTKLLVPGGAYEPSKWYGLLKTVNTIPNILLHLIFFFFLIFNFVVIYHFVLTSSTNRFPLILTQF